MLLSTTTDLAAQSVSARQFTLTAWGEEAGLLETRINGIAKTPDAWLWVATPKGMARFDGTRFQNFAREQWPVLDSSRMTAVAADTGTGRLYFANEAGQVALWEPSSEKVTIVQSFPLAAVDRIRSLLATPSVLWVGTRRGLKRLVDGKLTSVPAPVDSSEIFSITAAPDRSVWIVSSKGTFRWSDAGAVTEVEALKGVANLRSLVLTELPVIWASTVDAGVYRIDGQSKKRFGAESGLGSDRAIWLQQDPSGRIWSGTERGISLIDSNGIISTLTTAQGMRSDPIYSLLADHEGNVWIGTLTGLHRLRLEAVQTYSASDGLGEDHTWSVLESAQSGLWIATDAGLANFSANKWRRWTHADGLPNESAGALAEDRAGVVWVGTNGGLFKYDRGRKGFVGIETKGPQRAVYCLAVDRAGRIWEGSDDGVRIFEPSGKKPIQVLKATSGAPVSSIFMDDDGSTWIGTRDRGFFHVVNDEAKDVSTLLPRDSRYAFSIHRDRKGHLLVGTRYEGLFLYTGQRFVKVTLAGAVPMGTVFSMVNDSDGNLWVAGGLGLTAILLKDLDRLAESRIDAVPVRRFGLADGLRSTNFAGGTQPAAWSGSGGRLWFATDRGVSVVTDPKSLLEERLPKPTAPIAALADGVALSPCCRVGPIQIPARTARLQIAFSTLALPASHRVRFRYRMDEGDWIPTAGDHVATLASLSAGEHQIEYGSGLGDSGSWSEPNRLLLYRVPRVNETVWFRALIAASVLFCGWLVYQMRTRSLLNAERRLEAARYEERLAVARDLHDNLAQHFNGLVLQLESALVDTQKPVQDIQPLLSRCVEIARRGLRESRRALASLRMGTKSTVDITASLDELVQRCTSEHGREIEMRTEGLPFPVPSAIEPDMIAIAQEGLLNAIRHANAASIHLELQYGTEGLVLAIHDDGTGFAEQQRNGHYGLLGLRERAEALGGKVSVRTERGEGTSIMVSVPVRRVG